MTVKVWTVEKVSVYPAYEEHTNLVHTADWRITGTDGEYSATRYGTVSISYIEGNPYIPFDDLTQDQVVDWVKAALGASQVAAHEAFIDQSILNKLNPSIINIRTPWS